jgi:hypothetical protein
LDIDLRFTHLAVIRSEHFHDLTAEWMIRMRDPNELLWLASYCGSSLLVLLEQVWRWLRAVVTHTHYFGSLDAAIAAAKRFFAKLVEQPEAVLRLSG